MDGLAYVALGDKAVLEAGKSSFSYFTHNKRINLKILNKPLDDTPAGMSIDQQAHWAKVNAFWWTNCSRMLLLDADTRVKGDLSFGFKLLKAGWEIVLVPSKPPTPGAFLWSLSGAERDYIFSVIGLRRHIMLNTGVLFFNKTARVERLFELWRDEWLRFKDRDQGAFLRALRRRPVCMFLLGFPFNSSGGDVVDHIFGAARR